MDTLAARLREAFLGTETGEAVPFDELKDAVKDRWQRVADAAREVPALAAARERGRRAALRVPSVEELATIGHEANTNFVVHEDAATAIRDAVLAGVADAAAIRVPFSDAQIERMAVAHREAYASTKDEWQYFSPETKANHCGAIRAALAAGGLEPCAVPDYEPDDVALRPSDDEVEKLARVLDDAFAESADLEPKWDKRDGEIRPHRVAQARAAIAHLRPTQGHVLRDRLVEAKAKIERQRAALATLNNLRQLDAGTRGALMSDISNAVCNAMDRLPDAPWKDKTATEAVWLLSLAVGNLRAEVDEDNAAHAAIDAPAGVPSVEELIPLVGKQLDITYDEKFSPYSSRGWEYTRAILAALRPWLRDPVGCELDVTEQAIRNAWLDGEHVGNTWDAARKVLDLCRKRIKPVYECKECAKKDDEYQDLISATNDEADRINRAMDAINAARAALEGE